MTTEVIRRVLTAWTGACVIAWVLAPSATAAETVLADFNDTGFDYTFAGFSQATSPSSVRLYDPVDGWGGGGLTLGNANLSADAGGRLSLDVTRESGHGTDAFSIELIDSAGRSGKWAFDATQLVTGVPTTLTATTTLANPTSGVGDFANLNLGQIDKLQVLGQFDSTNPFNLSIGSIAVDGTAPPYQGWEPDAPWRAEAAARIDANRKADLQVRVLDPAGMPLPGAQVHVDMQRHEFTFGTAVQAPKINGSGSSNQTYRDKLVELFNAATFENSYKWPFWVGDRGSAYSPQKTLTASQWLASQGFTVRGHAQVWPGTNFLPTFMVDKVNEYYAPGTTGARKAQLAGEMRQEVLDHIDEIGAAAAGRVEWWDVLNEPRVNHVLMDILGQDVIVEWFNRARVADPNAKLFVNEYGILPSYGGTNNNSEQQSLLNTLNRLNNAGAPLDGVGLQAHFSDSNLTGIEQLWSIIDQYDNVVDSVHITEFDIDTTDEQLQGDYFRDFLTAMFAHEAIDAFSVWGFWEDAVFVRDRAMFRSDWSAKPNGQAWLDLVYGEWWTDEMVDAGADGEATVRAFRGEYNIEATHNGVAGSAFAALGEGGAVVEIHLATYAADFNGDGQVDAADYAVWTQQYGAQGAMSADGNGDGVVDAADYTLWRDTLAFIALSGEPTAIPEPTAFKSTALAALAAARMRRSAR